MTVELRRVRPDDWPRTKALRLEALLDTPLAYCETYADAAAQPDEVWQARAAQGAEGGDSYQVLAWADGGPVATTVCFLDRGDAVLAAVYIAPAHRGQGLLAAMVDAVAGWARTQGAPRLRLLVHEGNAPARGAYERLGFALTGHREPYPQDPSSDEVEMARPL